MRRLLVTIALVSIIIPSLAWAATSDSYFFVTRAETVKLLLLSRLQNVPPVLNTGDFSDVPAGMMNERYMLMAVRYGIVSAQPGTTQLRPYGSVTRADFLKMLAATFGLPLDLPYAYRDVSTTSWYSHYAGIATRYQLFPTDIDQFSLHADNGMREIELALALRQFLDRQQQEQNAEAMKLSEDQSRYKLTMYQNISTVQQNVKTVQLPVYLFPQASAQPETLAEFSAVVPAQSPAPPGKQLALLRTSVIELSNRERAKDGLPPLKQNPLLDSSAQTYADDMAAKGYFSHVSPEGQTLLDRVKASGFAKRSGEPCPCIETYVFGENLTRGPITAEGAVDAWLQSPSHHAAIVSPSFSDIGVGIHGEYWVEHFGGVKKQ